MRAAFVSSACLVKGKDRRTALAALAPLAESTLYTVLINTASPETAQGEMAEATATRLVEEIAAAGGRVDAEMHCPHKTGEACSCWHTHPGFLWQAARHLDLRLDESYVICDTPNDVSLAYMAGCRPILVLNGRTIEELYDGFQPEPSDFPVARDLRQAVSYLLSEEEVAQELGHARPAALSQGVDETEGPAAFPEDLPPSALPTLTAYTARPQPDQAQPQVIRYGGRWLVWFIVGGIWLSLGIAYLLTHLYRVRPFPEFVYYITLQFIPRPVRGALFILTGAIALLVALRSVRESLPVAIRWGKGKSR